MTQNLSIKLDIKDYMTYGKNIDSSNMQTITQNRIFVFILENIDNIDFFLGNLQKWFDIRKLDIFGTVMYSTELSLLL